MPHHHGNGDTAFCSARARESQTDRQTAERGDVPAACRALTFTLAVLALPSLHAPGSLAVKSDSKKIKPQNLSRKTEEKYKKNTSSNVGISE